MKKVISALLFAVTFGCGPPAIIMNDGIELLCNGKNSEGEDHCGTGHSSIPGPGLSRHPYGPDEICRIDRVRSDASEGSDGTG